MNVEQDRHLASKPDVLRSRSDIESNLCLPLSRLAARYQRDGILHVQTAQPRRHRARLEHVDFEKTILAVDVLIFQHLRLCHPRQAVLRRAGIDRSRLRRADPEMAAHRRAIDNLHEKRRVPVLLQRRLRRTAGDFDPHLWIHPHFKEHTLVEDFLQSLPVARPGGITQLIHHCLWKRRTEIVQCLDHTDHIRAERLPLHLEDFQLLRRQSG